MILVYHVVEKGFPSLQEITQVEKFQPTKTKHQQIIEQSHLELSLHLLPTYLTNERWVVFHFYFACHSYLNILLLTSL